MLENIIVNYNTKEYNDIIKEILNNEISYDKIEIECAEFWRVPIVGLNKKYGITRDIILFIIGSAVFSGYLFIPNDYIYWNIILIFASIILSFVISRFLSFVILNTILNLLIKINNISLYYYITLLNGNLTLLIWSVFMLMLCAIYLPYFSLEIINIYIKNVYSIFTCTAVISITNYIRLIIIDFIIDVPSYKQFKIELEDFLSFYYKLHNIFGLLESNDKKIELPKYFTLPFIYKNNNPKTVNIKNRKDAKSIGKLLFRYFNENNKCTVGVDIDCFTSLFDHNNIKKNIEDLFSLLDTNSTGTISEEKFINICELLYDNYNNLSHGLVVNRTATKALELIVLIIYIFIIIFIILLILNIDIQYLYTSITALTAVWAFALSTSITRFVESILFITVYRVYDIGDVINVNNNILTVKNIKLYNTFFICNKGCEVSISNSLLSTFTISNLYRSKHSLIEYNLEIINNFEKLNFLRNEIDLFLKKPNKWSSDFELNIKSSSTKNLNIKIKLKHQLSWKQNNQINISKNDFLMELNFIMDKLNIEYQII